MRDERWKEGFLKESCSFVQKQDGKKKASNLVGGEQTGSALKHDKLDYKIPRTKRPDSSKKKKNPSCLK